MPIFRNDDPDHSAPWRDDPDHRILQDISRLTDDVWFADSSRIMRALARPRSSGLIAFSDYGYRGHIRAFLGAWA